MSQHTATVLYPEPVKSDQHFHMHFNIILPFLPSYTTVHTVDLLLCLRVRQQFKHVGKNAHKNLGFSDAPDDLAF